YWGDLADFALEPLAEEGIGTQQYDLTERNARDVLLVHLGDHLQGFEHADAEQDLPGFGDLTYFAVPSQHNAVDGRGNGTDSKLLELHGEGPLDRAQIHRHALVSLRGGGAAADQLSLAVEFALGELFARAKFLELRAHLPVIEASQHVTLGDNLALAVADFDD